MIKKILHKFRKERDLTTGSISKAIWILAIPMIISNMLQAAFNIVDMAWVGRLGADALAAVAMSGQILMIVMFVMMGVSVGTTAMVSRAIGAKDQERADNVAMQSMIMGFMISVVLSTIGYIYSPWMLKILGAEAGVITLGSGYMQLIFVGVIVMFSMFLISAVLQGAGDAVTPMLILMAATIINIILDPIMIFGFWFIPKMGVNGAALATIISEGIGSLIALEILLRGRSRVHVRLKYLRVDWGIIGRILGIGIPASAQMSLRGLVGIVIIAVVASFGTYAIAAYGVGMRLIMMSFMPGFALGMAAGTLVGQNLGAGKPERSMASAWTSAGYFVLFMAVMTVFYVTLAPYLIRLFNNQPDVIRIGTNFLRVVALGNIFAALGIVFSRSTSGAGDTVPPMIITFIALWLVQIPLAIYLSRLPNLGLRGIWLAILAAHVVQGLLATGWFQVGRWKHKRV